MQKSLFVLITMLLAGVQQASGFQQSEPRKPNVIVILTDDQGYADTGFQGSQDIRTPNIDRIAQNGIVFSQGYVTHPVCGPSRAAILTGRHQDRFGAGRNPLFAPNDSTMGLPLSEQNMAEALSEANYRSSFMGKWHLGAHWKMYPLQQGFDEFFGFLSGGHRYFPEEWTLNDNSEAGNQWDGYRTRLMRNNGWIDENEYVTDALSREGEEFIARQSAENPFFLFMSYNAPHTPLQATQKYLDRFPDISDNARKTYAAMMSAVDDGVGAILDKLEEKGLDENTIIFFLTDNGGASNNASDNSPLRGAKSSFFEGGLRVPFAVSWPAVLPAGTTYDKPVSSMDIMATALAEAGVEPENPLDGVNLIPFLTGENTSSPHETLFWRNFDRNIYTVRNGDLKLINDNGTISVFNLANDLSEANSSKIPFNDGYHGHLMDLIDNWKSEIIDPVYLGLQQDAEYNRLNPDRFDIPSPHAADYTAIDTPEGYELIWNQEFNASGAPDEQWWSFENGFVRNQELQWYQPQNVSISSGVLEFEGKREVVENPNYDPDSDNWRENREQANYTSASINTRDKFTFKYGIMEVRAKIDTSLGSWPAIWTLGADRNWPDRGEVDLMEFYRRDDVPSILANAAWRGQDTGNVLWDGAAYPLAEFIERMPDFTERFHLWRMEWDEDQIKLFLNDELLNTINIEEATYADGFNPFRQPHYILLNLAIGSNGGNPSNTEFPLFYEVDYVRVFQKKKPDNEPDPTDLIDIDGNSYNTVEIDDRIWMAENLRTSTFRNGDPIPLIGSSEESNSEWSETTSPAHTVFRGNTGSVDVFGYLYNFNAVVDERGVCPDGWRVPTEDDWKALELDAGMPDSELDRDGWGGATENVAGKLKSTNTNAWNSPNEGATNELGFGWVAGSVRYAYGAFESAASQTVFGSIWSASESSAEEAYRRLVRFNRSDIRRNTVAKKSGLSIRCVTNLTVNTEETTSLPKQLDLKQNYPNPFNPSTSISFYLPQSNQVTLSVFDILGRKVATITESLLPAGSHTFTVNTSDWSSGVYIYRLQTSQGVLSKQMTLTK
jgi:uncharacterized protein (TIGR02145 family)